jgi:gliding motility-associatede transport system auxiliary component
MTGLAQSRGLRSTLLVVGLLAIYAGERLAPPDGKLHGILVVLGLVSVAAATIALRILALRAAHGERRKVEARIAIASGGVAFSLLVYGLGTETGQKMLGVAGDAESKVPGILAVLFPIVLVCSLLPLLFMEMSYASMPSEPSVERRRIDVSAHAGLVIALALSMLFALGFALEGWGKKWDFSYFKTTRPSAGTKRMMDRLGEPLDVYAYYPKVNDVRDQVMPYLRELGRASKKVKIHSVDQALRPSLAREHRVTKNGTIVLAQGDKHESVAVGLELEEARTKLRKLDGDFQKAFLKLTRPRRTLYLTVGHKERGESDADDPEEMGTEDWKALLEELGIATRNLGIGQGLGNEIPGDATAVSIMGPREKFLPEEAHTLASWVEGGGHLLMFLDPDETNGLEPVLTALGLRVLPGTVVSESNHFVRDHTKADNAVVFTNRFSAHPTASSASRLSSRIASVFVGGGAIDKVDGAQPEGRNTTFSVRSLPGAWRDLDGDYEYDDGPEKKEPLNLVSATTIRPGRGGADGEGRAVVVGDADFATDQVLRNPGNVTIVVDTLRWLVGEADIAGPPESEEDVRIEHTRDEDVVWFYGTIFAVPVVVLGAGLGSIQLSKRRRKK